MAELPDSLAKSEEIFVAESDASSESCTDHDEKLSSSSNVSRNDSIGSVNKDVQQVEQALDDAEDDADDADASADVRVAKKAKYAISILKNTRISLKQSGKSSKTLSSLEEALEEIEMGVSRGGVAGVSVTFDIPNPLPVHSDVLRVTELRRLVEIEHLYYLNLTGVELPENDFQFGNLVNVKTLIMDDTNIRLLHPTIGRLSQLTTLSLRFNRLYDLPVTIRLLRNLKHIKLTGNLFRSLPSSVYHLNNLKTIEGLNENLLEEYPNWQKGKPPIASTPPLPKPNPPRECIDSLSSIALTFAIGMNIWLIPLPDKYRREIIHRTETHDLCEGCLAPVKKIMANQETNGHLIKVCLYEFKGYRNVPFSFFTCCSACNDVTVSRLHTILNQQTSARTNKKKRLTNIVLKHEHSRPTRVTRNSFYSSGGSTRSSTISEDNTSSCMIL